MKKLFLIFVCIFCAFSCSFFIPNQTVNAEQITVTEIKTKVKDGVDSYITPVGGIHYINFNNGNADPYKTHTIELDLTLSTGQSFDELNNVTKSFIIANTKWKIDEQPITFSNGKFESTKYKLTLSEKNLEIKLLKAGFCYINCSIDSASATTILMANYAEPSKINLTAIGSTDQLYETYSEITLKAELDNQSYLNENIDYTFSWYIGSTDSKNLIPNQSSNTLVITKDLLNIEKMKFIVVLQQNSTIQKSIDINIGTNQEYSVSLNYTETVELKTDDDSIDIQVFVPSSNYRVIWYLNSPSSHVFDEQQTTTVESKQFTFNPAAYKPGKYKLFAKVLISQQQTNQTIEVLSQILVINLSKNILDPDIELKIIKREYSNEQTGIQGFLLSVDLQDYYPEDRVVWIVEGSSYGKGSQIQFNPELANEYYIELRLLDEAGRVINTGGPLANILIDAQPVQTMSLWLFCGIAVGCILLACVASILISNKIREKIW